MGHGKNRTSPLLYECLLVSALIHGLVFAAFPGPEKPPGITPIEVSLFQLPAPLHQTTPVTASKNPDSEIIEETPIGGSQKHQKKSVIKDEPVTVTKPEGASNKNMTPVPSTEKKKAEKLMRDKPSQKTKTAYKDPGESVIMDAPVPQPMRGIDNKVSPSPAMEIKRIKKPARETSSSETGTNPTDGIKSASVLSEGIGHTETAEFMAGDKSLIKKKINASNEFNNASDYLGMLRTRINQFKIYPESARKRRIQGKVNVEFILLRDGRLKKLKIIKSSRNRYLDDAALDAIRKASPFPNPPETIFKTPLTLRINIFFELV